MDPEQQWVRRASLMRLDDFVSKSRQMGDDLPFRTKRRLASK